MSSALPTHRITVSHNKKPLVKSFYYYEEPNEEHKNHALTAFKTEHKIKELIDVQISVSKCKLVKKI